MANSSLEVGTWAEQQFSQCELGDRRRTRRLVKMATQAALKPDASTPEQAERWADCKAAYNLFDQDDVTFEAIVAPHCAATRQVEAGVWLVLNDTTELNFGYLREIEGIGRVGSPANRGFFLHTALLVRPDGSELRGLAAQELYTRPLEKVPRVSSAERKLRTSRETDVWGRVIDAVGPPPGEARFIHVCDRGADDFDVYLHLLSQGCGWVIRAAQLGRKVHGSDERELRLDELLAAAPVLGSYTLEVRAQPGRAARTAEIEVRAARFAMPPPKSGPSRYAREQGGERITMWGLEVREVSSTPHGVEPLRWVLLTSEPAKSFAAAWRTIEYYERRPLIEEYHKCLKTGCRIEARQYRTADRLAPAIGLASILSVRLLQLKFAAAQEPDRPATDVVPRRWIRALKRVLRKPRPIKTARDFLRALAGLGGFLGRTGDGEPGWQTIWRGLDTLLLCLRGADAMQDNCG